SSVAPDPSVSNTATAATNGNNFQGSAHVAIARNVTLSAEEQTHDISVRGRTGWRLLTITVHNSGPSDAASTHITDTVDTRLNVTNASDTGACQASTASSGQSIDFTLAPRTPSSTLFPYATLFRSSSVAPDPSVSNTATAATNGNNSQGSAHVAIARNVTL